jgi:Xaa-Pro dipeptidase
MAVTADAIPLTGVPFTEQEYARRQRAVVDAFEEAGIDAIAVTAHSHLEYLTGYDGSGGYFAPFPLLLSPGRAPTYVVRRYDEDAVRAQSCVDDIVTYAQDGDLPTAWADALRRAGADRGRLGLELGCWNLAPRDVVRLQEQLADATIVDATRVVASVAAVKSDVEIDVMRRAMALTRLAVETFYRSLREGVCEAEVAALIDRAIADAGGESRPYALLFGRRTALPHGNPGANRLERDQPAFTELSGWVHGYAAGLCRTAVLGRHEGAERLHALAEDALQAAIDTIRPGATAGEVDAACRSVIERAGKANAFRHRAGYQIGLVWLDRGNISLEPGAPGILRPGMTFHLPIILFERCEYGVGVSETVLVTDDGADVLSGLPRAIHRA